MLLNAFIMLFYTFIRQQFRIYVFYYFTTYTGVHNRYEPPTPRIELVPSYTRVMIMPSCLLLGYIFSHVCTSTHEMCIIVCMKVRINISISEEANNILNLQSNKSQYLEDLILGKHEPSVPSLTEARVIELIKEYAPKTEQPFVPKAPDPILGYPCCQLKRPCKHWVWDSGLECYENTLTGEQRKDSSVVDVHEL